MLEFQGASVLQPPILFYFFSFCLLLRELLSMYSWKSQSSICCPDLSPTNLDSPTSVFWVLGLKDHIGIKSHWLSANILIVQQIVFPEIPMQEENCDTWRHVSYSHENKYFHMNSSFEQCYFNSLKSRILSMRMNIYADKSYIFMLEIQSFYHLVNLFPNLKFFANHVAFFDPPKNFSLWFQNAKSLVWSFGRALFILRKF